MKGYFTPMAIESTKITRGVRRRRPKLSKASGAEYPKDDSRMERLKETSKGKTVAFGSWRIKARALPLKEAMARVESSNTALSRAKKSLMTSGVKLSPRKNVPLYSADPKQPDILIRQLNGRTERVHLVDGEFKPAE